MWLHYIWYRNKIRYEINTVPTPTVAWTRAWLLQGGGGTTLSNQQTHRRSSTDTVPNKFAKRKATVPSPAWLLIKGSYCSRGWGYTPAPQANIRITDGIRAVHINAKTKNNITACRPLPTNQRQLTVSLCRLSVDPGSSGRPLASLLLRHTVGWRLVGRCSRKGVCNGGWRVPMVV